MNEKLSIGFDVGGTKTACGIYTNTGQCLGKRKVIETLRREGPASLAERLPALVQLVISGTDITLGDIDAIGFGVPAPVSEDGILMDGANLGPAWANANFVQLMPRAGFKQDLVIEVNNDGNCAAFGEWSQSLGRPHGTYVLVTIGTGLGAGCVVNGRILKGRGAAFELGRVPITLDEKRYINGGTKVHPETRWAEHYVSLTALERQIKTLRELGRLEGHRLGTGEVDEAAKQVRDLALSGDELALGLFAIQEEALGRLFAMLHWTLNPHSYIVGGGGLSESSEAFEDQFLDGVRTHLSSLLTADKPGTEPAPVTAARFGDEAGLVGAALAALEVL